MSIVEGLSRTTMRASNKIIENRIILSNSLIMDMIKIIKLKMASNPISNTISIMKQINNLILKLIRTMMTMRI